MLSRFCILILSKHQVAIRMIAIFAGNSLNSELKQPPLPLEFQTALPPHVFGIPVQETPALPRNSKMPLVVWYGYFLESPNANVQKTTFSAKTLYVMNELLNGL